MGLGMYRQRRRITLVMMLATYALALGLISGTGWITAIIGFFGNGLSATLQGSAWIILTVFLLLMAILRMAPAQRQQTEVVAAGLAVFETFHLALTMFGVTFASPILAICTFGLAVLLVDHVIYGRLLDALGFWKALSSRVDFEVSATPNAAWNAIVPRPDTVGTHWIGALTAVTPTREPDTFVARYRLGDGTILHKTLTTLSEEHPMHIRYHFEPEADDEESRYGAGFFEVWFNELDEDLTQVGMQCEYASLRLRTAAQLWLDDWLGSEADAIQAFIERRPDTSIHARLWRDVLRQT